MTYPTVAAGESRVPPARGLNSPTIVDPRSSIRTTPMTVKIVLFDALYTLVQPRIPIFEQASKEFVFLRLVDSRLLVGADPDGSALFDLDTLFCVVYHRVLTPHVGPLDKYKLKTSFKTALGELQTERPAYRGKTEAAGAKSWWGEVIRRTALGAGADVAKVNDPERLTGAVDELLDVFSSKASRAPFPSGPTEDLQKGYKLVDGALHTISTLNQLGVKTGLVSNSDSGILKALKDLEATDYLDPVLVSDLEGTEKPDPRMWELACRRADVEIGEAVHVGDEYNADVLGAIRAGVRPIWFRPPGIETHVDADLLRVADDGVSVVETLPQVVELVRLWNSHV